MYVPAHFREEDTNLLHRLMEQYSFATLVTCQGRQPFASHLPFLLDAERGECGVLRAHMARANPQWQSFAKLAEEGGEPEVLAIFQGPHAYISPSWYQKHPAVPTWNYAVVHAYGRPRLLSEAELRATLEESAAFYEAPFEQPWTMGSLPDTFLDGMVKAVVGFEIQITRLEGKFKLSQNRPEGDRAQVIAHLRHSGSPLDQHTADWMENTSV